jgi:hypothetical protein
MPREASIAVSRVTSRDGTSIAYHRQGSGPAVVLVTGALDDGSENAPLASELALRYQLASNALRLIAPCASMHSTSSRGEGICTSTRT